ncbi:MAG: DUF1116 domain-containing protein [Rubrivivax sp.]|nr:DUF1116 domain-containing protein [Rubrivivax sp.]
MMNSAPNNLLAGAPAVLNVGIDAFNASVTQHGGTLVNVDWRPPGNAQPLLAWNLARALADERIDAANAEATQRIIGARPLWEDIALRADGVWPELRGTRLVLHAGPPVAWQAMCGPMRGALVGAVLYEGWAQTPEQATQMLARGEVEFAQCHDFGAVGPMTGIISASMPLIQVREATRGRRAYTNLNEGIGRCLRFGANGPDVLQRLKWFENVLAPVLKAGVREVFEATGGMDLKAIQAQALLMGDEVHSRNAASTSLLFMQLAVALAAPRVREALPAGHVHQALEFIARSSQFFLNYSMVSCKAIMDSAHGVPHSTVVTATARNGTETGLRVSGLGPQWFTAPSDFPQGLFFPGFTQADACPDIGDSAITETAGFGGCSFAASPALTLLAGGSVSDALRYSREMHEVCVTRNPGLSLPALDFAGAPCGIDVRKVLDTGIRPVMTTGIAHREAGIGQIGAGIVRVPMACYVRAFEAVAAQILR